MPVIMYFQKAIETMKRQDIDILQLERLKWTVEFCNNNIPFYHARLQKHGVTADKIKCLSDIQYIPFTTKDDIRDTYPFGLFGRPMKEIVRIHASSGTTGKPTVVGYTKSDINYWACCVARLATAVGITDEDIIQIAFGYGLFTGALGLHYGLEKLGATVIPASSGNTQKQVMLLKDFGVTGLVSTPSYALYMGEVLREEGISISDLKLKTGLFGSEGCTLEMRAQVEKSLNLFATDNYGLSELMGPGVSGECYMRNGMHVNEDHFIPEIIDPNSGEVLENGATGELVITTITKEGIPMLRYRTKDITSLNYDVCECGRTHVRMDKISGRSDDMLKIRGVNVFPSQIESVLVGTAHIGAHYQLVVRREGYMDTLEVKVELVDSSLLEQYGELELLQKAVKNKLKTVLGIDCKISLVEQKSLERFAGKAQRIVDLRDKHEK